MGLARMLAGALRAPLTQLMSRGCQIRLIEPAPDALPLEPTLPVLYVLSRPALSDTLLLETLARAHDLPAAGGQRRVGSVTLPACLALPAPGRRLWRRGRRSAAPFQPLIEQYRRDPAHDAQLVPVSVFWGRAPGKRFGVWQLLAADSWRLTGRLRRLLSVAVNGRDVEVQFGTPLRLSELNDDRDPALTNRKVARLLRGHFRRTRTRVLGPDLSHRRTLIDGVVASAEVQRAIGEVAAAEKATRPRIARRARRYGREIASDMTYPVMRFMAGALRRLWNRLYDGVEVRGLSRVKALAGDHTLVYVPCHRSHIDYLLLSYALYREGLMPPHIAAGRNLDMPLIGPLLRRGGAFFMRRSFRDNRLYAAVFNEYLHRLLSRGHPLEYFMEGGRSRSGRLLPARPGMLAMTLRSFLRSRREGGRDVLFVPVYLGYERILENASYQREMRGADKRRESPLALLGVTSRLRQPHGRVDVNVGEPLSLSAFLDAQVPGWRQAPEAPRPAWLNRVVPALGETLSQRINAAAALNPVNLVALVLLATPHRAIEAGLLTRQLALLVALQRRLPGGRDASLPTGTPEAWIDQVAALGMIGRHPHPLGDIIVADARQAGLLGWYRNNVLHLFALAGLTAFAFRHQACHRLDDLAALLGPGWPILARELAIEPAPALHEDLAAMLEALVEQGLLEREDEGWRRPRESLAAGEQLDMLGALMQPSLERGYLLLSVLLSEPSGHFTAEALTERSRLLAERLALLSGRDAPEFFDARLFAGLVESLAACGWLATDDGRLTFGEALREAARHSRALFDPALRHRLQLVSRRGEG
ncbi:glycerol-3-phosphate 1-O-acyltransferase PlsB [Halomonas saccharevitans]|uniref:Glycerol-3-phosphate acyltransferase n=1 Tax=Halomonas saccharevitans TaxID=416872 RepID=A0ABU3NG70_9GAMM|nr:glycerol-3-phosphate 1-O-acyltransferase PlsB [Halomonas saccharevitans]MDT8880174.1 glycerol-3-phosphate 1-O-acyltransferase PlsB [Halomonas saccharevitans]